MIPTYQRESILSRVADYVGFNHLRSVQYWEICHERNETEIYSMTSLLLLVAMRSCRNNLWTHLMKFPIILAYLSLLLSGQAVQASLNDWEIPESNWRRNEQTTAYVALEQTERDVLVIPFRCIDSCFGRIELMLLTRLVAEHTQSSAGLTVVPISYASRALGPHLQSFEFPEILRLAGHTRVSSIVAGEILDRTDNSFALRLDIFDAASGSKIRSQQWDDLSFSDEHPPSTAILEVMPEIVLLTAGRPQMANRNEKIKLQGEMALPTTLQELITQSERSGLHAAIYLQYLAALHPRETYNEALNDLLERSIIALGRVDPASSDYRYLLARAYAHLDRRPMALKIVGDPSTSQERALVAAINGNLPTLRKETIAIESPMYRFFATKDLLRLESIYDKKDAIKRIDQLIDPDSEWASFMMRALQDEDNWAVHSPLVTKLGLEALLPVDVPSAESFYVQRTAMGLPLNDFEQSKLVLQHIDKLRDQNEAAWTASAMDDAAPHQTDIMGIALETLVSNVLRAFSLDLYARAQPEHAVQLLEQFDPLFSGHPELTLYLGVALRKLSQERDGAEKVNLISRSESAFRNGLIWSGELTLEGASVGRSVWRYFPNKEEARTRRFSMTDEKYRQDEWPMRAEWLNTSQNGDRNQLATCIDYTWTKIACLQQILKLDDQAQGVDRIGREAILGTYADRFNGHPQRYSMVLDNVRRTGTTDEVNQFLTRHINDGAVNWEPYWLLGGQYVRNGRYQEAEELFLSYPGFSATDGINRVQISGYAGNAASDLYWAGAYQQSKALMAISAGSGSGSFSEYSSNIRLALIDGNLAGATEFALARARRYINEYSIRDLIALLYIQGEDQVASSLFDQLLPQIHEPQIWTGALVGHRMSGASTADILSWLSESDARKSATYKERNNLYNHNLAPRYLLISATFDRQPGPGLVDAVKAIQNGPRPQYYVQGFVGIGNTKMERDPLVPAYAVQKPTQDRIEFDSRYEFIARAMTSFLSADYQSAFEQFNETANYYLLDEYLPYFALAAGLLNKHSHLNAALQAREEKLEGIRIGETEDNSIRGYRFNEDLTAAVLAAFSGDHNLSLDKLKAAINNRPYTIMRSIYTYYQVVDIADRLFEITKNSGYRDFALDLARKHIVIQPMYAWAYFVVAKHSESRTERVTALASGFHLDPNSYRGSLLSNSLQSEAKLYLTKNGPPYLRARVSQEKNDI